MRFRFFILAVVTFATAAHAAPIRVPAQQPTIQAGIAAASAGDTVLVAPGRYLVNDLALRSGVTLRGARDSANDVVLDGRRLGRVVDCANVQDVALEGLVITGGQRLAGWFDDAGGGVRCLDARVRLTDCRIEGNRASIGAGLALWRATVIMERCAISDNHAEHANWTGGGGVWSRSSTGTVRDCAFTSNSAFSVEAPGDGGGFFTEAGGLDIQRCTFWNNATGAGGGGFYSYDQDSTRLTDCRFHQNSATWAGAAYLERSLATLTRCVFIENAATQGAGAVETVDEANTFVDCQFIANRTTAYDGGALQSWSTDLVLDGCFFRGNTAAAGGGALFLASITGEIRDCVFFENVAPNGGAIRLREDTTPHLIGCTFAANRATTSGGAIHVATGSGAVLDRCIIAYASAGVSLGGSLTAAVSLTCTDIFGNAGGDWVAGISGQLGQDGNLSADPLFCDLALGDLRLGLDSPCRAENSPVCGQIGALETGCAWVDVPSVSAPALVVHGAMPNPFNPATTLRYTLGQPGWTTLDIYDLAGRRVRALAAAFLAAGDHEAVWNGRDDGGRLCPAGVYHVVVGSGRERASVRLALVK